uniref:Uncharacterized protein n=1 Tax=Oryza sativa subsp. japonica TaxID=39947 RepID=Q84YN1_ORYSJ|nr:unknown protein [Oryza sativa Japonica Group]
MPAAVLLAGSFPSRSIRCFTAEESMDDQCLHCKKTRHSKKDHPDFLIVIMAKKGIPFSEDYAKEVKDPLELPMELKQKLKLLEIFA